MKLTLILCLAIIFYSCAVLRITPPYSQKAVNMVKSGMESTDALYDNMMASTNKEYSTFESDYMDIARQINEITTFYHTRANSRIIHSTIVDIKERFSKYEFEHKSKGSINNAEVQSYKDGMQALWKSLYNSEINFKP